MILTTEENKFLKKSFIEKAFVIYYEAKNGIG
jgi:hypothetical protein